MQLIYASRPFGYDDLALTGILAIARTNNTRDGITGALVCRHDLYLQLLEGPADAVTQTFARIARDDRHTEVTKLVANETDHRLFPDWAMWHDPARSLMWSGKDVSEGAVTRASPAEVVAVFEHLSQQPAPIALA